MAGGFCRWPFLTFCCLWLARHQIACQCIWSKLFTIGTHLGLIDSGSASSGAGCPFTTWLSLIPLGWSMQLDGMGCRCLQITEMWFMCQMNEILGLEQWQMSLATSLTTLIVAPEWRTQAILPNPCLDSTRTCDWTWRLAAPALASGRLNVLDLRFVWK
jgi:hypothetical protein